MKKDKLVKIELGSNITEEDLEKNIGKFQAEALLKKIYEYGRMLFNNDEAIRGVLSVPYTLKNGPIFKEGTFMILAWELVDLAYYTIKYTNDYRGKSNIAHEEMISLLNLVRSYNDKNSDIEKNPFLFYLYTMTGEQFKYQILFTLDYIKRENYILFDCSRRIDEDVNLEKEFNILTGYSWKEVITILSMQFERNDGLIYTKVNFDENDFNIDGIVDKYTATYYDIRDSLLGRQHFYIQPYIKTQKNNYLQVSPFLSAFIIEHCTYWLLRDEYLKKGNDTLPSKFGESFEIYLHELFEELIPNNYERLEEDKKNKIADWRIEVGDYIFLVEQKSGLLNLDVKQQISNIDNLKTFFVRNIISAIEQLDNTEKELESKKCIKIILLYDDYLKAEILDEVFKMEECHLENDRYYWLVNIDEFEILFYTYKRDKKVFFDIIKEKIKLEEEESNKGREIAQLLSRKGINTNEYLKNEKFANYELRSIGTTVINKNNGGNQDDRETK